MLTLQLLHRWLGIAFCLFFAMWFASGAVMHWVPFPELSESERVAGLPTLPTEPLALTLPPAQALATFGGDDIARLRLVTAGGRAVYIALTTDHTLLAREATSGVPLIVDAAFALTSASSHAATRGLDTTQIKLIDTVVHDQWTVSNNLDSHRPLFHLALNDAAGIELYVSSVTGEVVRDTTRSERLFNYAGSVLHWIYPTALRKHWAAWDTTVWWLALACLLGAISGALLGVLRLHKLTSPFRGLMYWHHVTGLTCAVFLLTWIASGWLSMDHGRLFSDGRPQADEIATLSGPPLTARELADNAASPAGQREIEWSRFAGRVLTGPLTVDDSLRAANRLGPHCINASDDDAYAARSRTGGATVFRIACDEIWWQIDGADGRIIEKLDASRRAYRWAFRALHTLDFPALADRPALRSGLIMLLCGGGLFFSLTGVVIGWRRLKRRTGVRTGVI
jgi:PepSY-associated TM region